MQAHITLGFILLISNFDLGLSKAQRQARIIGGEPSQIEKSPYQASVMYFGNHFCGGSVIGKKWILTAAHCTEESNENEITVRLGSTKSDKGGFVHKVLKIHVHPQYNEDTIDYDYAILELKTPIRYSNKIQPIALANSTKELKAGSKLTLSGWGTTEKLDVSPSLLTATVPYISDKSCKLLYPSETSPRMFCAGFLKGGIDACQGDSGGPLVMDQRQYGITSWGDGCGDEGSPGVYASVPDQRDWIRKVTGV